MRAITVSEMLALIVGYGDARVEEEKCRAAATAGSCPKVDVEAYWRSRERREDIAESIRQSLIQRDEG